MYLPVMPEANLKSERKEIKDIIAYLRLVNNLDDDLAYERIINVPKRGIGKTTLSKISKISRINNISMLNATQIFIQKNFSKIKFLLFSNSLTILFTSS